MFRLCCITLCSLALLVGCKDTSVPYLQVNENNIEVKPSKNSSFTTTFGKEGQVELNNVEVTLGGMADNRKAAGYIELVFNGAPVLTVSPFEGNKISGQIEERIIPSYLLVFFAEDFSNVSEFAELKKGDRFLISLKGWKITSRADRLVALGVSGSGGGLRNDKRQSSFFVTHIQAERLEQ